MDPEEYWNQDDAHRDQKFYISFCMLETAISDYAIARDLHFHHKLNWACTAYYYSIVHSFRLLCFMIFGDFPTKHQELLRLFYRNENLQRNRRPIRCDWLGKFANGRINIISLNHDSLSDALLLRNHNNEVLQLKLEKWGKKFKYAKECRNDSNYEPLIIAHECFHDKVSDIFMLLANALREFSEEVIPFVISIFNNIVEASERKDFWKSYLFSSDRRGIQYLLDTLNYKLKGGKTHWYIGQDVQEERSIIFDTDFGGKIVKQVKEWLSILKPVEAEREKAEKVYENIRRTTFESKRNQMVRFKDNARRLEDC